MFTQFIDMFGKGLSMTIMLLLNIASLYNLLIANSCFYHKCCSLIGFSTHYLLCCG